MMSNEAFVLTEAVLLNTLGVLLADAYDSSVEQANSASFLDVVGDVAFPPMHSCDCNISRVSHMCQVPPPQLGCILPLLYA